MNIQVFSKFYYLPIVWTLTFCFQSVSFAAENTPARPKISIVGFTPSEFLESLHSRTLRPFRTDGCSLSPDGVPGSQVGKWVECCIHHDIAYWKGGTEQEKLISDKALRSCIAKKGYPKIASLYYVAVRQFGGPTLPATFRWGFGWSALRDYAPLEDWEIAKIEEQMDPQTQNLMALSISNPPIIDDVEPLKTNDEIQIMKFLDQHLDPGLRITSVAKLLKTKSKRTYLVKAENCPDGVLFEFNAITETPVQISKIALCRGYQDSE
jgi:hypothetical protein